VREFLGELKASDAGDFAAVLAGLAKLRSWQYHANRFPKRSVKLKTSQQQISRLESPGYEGHSLGMLRRVAKVLNARVHVTIEAKKAA
jgi:hypothetical protein